MGIDVGATRTKAVLLEQSKIIGFNDLVNAKVADPAKTALMNVLEVANRKVADVEAIAVSGGGGRQVENSLLELPVTKVDEIRAIGQGGLEIAKKQQALIVNMGTGTTLVAALDGGRRVEHIGGTGVGGGTIIGLSSRMLGTDDFLEIERMASKGNANKVDLTVADVTGGSVGIMPANATASNFGKLGADGDKKDIAAAIFNLIAEVVGIMASIAAKAYHLENDVVLVGKVVESATIATRIRTTAKMLQIKLIIPQNGDYCVALAAARSII